MRKDCRTRGSKLVSVAMPSPMTPGLDWPEANAALPKTAPPAKAAPTWLKNLRRLGPLLAECWGEPASVAMILLLFFMLILVDTDVYAANWLHLLLSP